MLRHESITDGLIEKHERTEHKCESTFTFYRFEYNIHAIISILLENQYDIFLL